MFTGRIERLEEPSTAVLAIDLCFAAALAAGGALALATGLGLAAFGAVVAGAVGFEYLLNRTVTGNLLASLEARDPLPPDGPVGRAVADLTADLGIERPRLVAGPADGGVTVVRDGGDSVLVVPPDLHETLDDGPLRGVLAHELAHVARGHLRRVPTREATGTVVGFAVCWAVFLSGLEGSLATLAALGYLAASVLRRNRFNWLVHVAGSLGVALALEVLAAKASRLEELAADDAAVARTTRTDFATGLYSVGAAAGGDGGVAGQRPFTDARSWIDRLTAPYPTIEDRLARLGVAPEDLRVRADPAAAEPTD